MQHTTKTIQCLDLAAAPKNDRTSLNGRFARLALSGLMLASAVACGFLEDSDSPVGTTQADSTADAQAGTSTDTKSLTNTAVSAGSSQRVSVARLNGATRNGTTATSSTTSTSTATTSGTTATTTTTTPTATTTNTTQSTTTTEVKDVGSTVNSIDTIVSDMALRNDFVLRGYENRTSGWYVGPGYTMLGNIPNLSNSPSWWMSGYSYRAPQTLRAILPWMVIFDGTGNQASNVRVHIRNVKLYIKSRSTGQWNSFGVSAGVNGWNYAKSDLFSTSGPEDKRTNSDGSVEVKPPSDTNLSWHGWWNLARVSINPDDVGAVHVTMQARLVVDNAALGDDRPQAEYGLQVGADYYIDPATSWDIVVPAVGISRTKRLTSSWQAYNMTTLNDVGLQEPGGGISQASLRAAPPPIE